MPRVDNDSLCLICGKTPCACFAKPIKRAVPKPRAAEPVEKIETQKPAPLNAMRQAAERAKLEQRGAQRVAPQKVPTRELSEADALFLSAIRALQSSFEVVFVNPADIEPYKRYLQNEASPAERAAAWRARRRLDSQSSSSNTADDGEAVQGDSMWE